MPYTDPGEMDKQIDIWDRPPNAMPLLLATGIHAKITAVDSTTQSPVAASLGQNIAWPKHVGQDISLVTHQIVTSYDNAVVIRSRGFIVYNDPDVGERIFDIDRCYDPDERKVERHILAFERMDGVDAFDAQLTTTLDILSRDTSIGDERGLSDPAFTPVARNIPCRVAEGKVAGKGKEDRSKTHVAIAYREVYMRPWFADPAPNGSFVPYTVISGVTYNTQPLTHNHWLLIPSASALNSNHEAVPGDFYDITEIIDPGYAHHHLEVACEVVLP